MTCFLCIFCVLLFGPGLFFHITIKQDVFGSFLTFLVFHRKGRWNESKGRGYEAELKCVGSHAEEMLWRSTWGLSYIEKWKRERNELSFLTHCSHNDVWMVISLKTDPVWWENNHMLHIYIAADSKTFKKGKIGAKIAFHIQSTRMSGS